MPNVSFKHHGSRIICTVVFSKDEVEIAEQNALERLGSSLKLPGFRPGKAPKDLMREKIPQEDLLEETVHLLLPSIEPILEERKISPVIPPKVTVTAKDPFTLEVILIERPAVAVKGADTLSIPKGKSRLTEKDTDEMIDAILKQYEEAEEVEREARQGDRVTIDFRAEDTDGKDLQNVRGENRSVVLGSKTLIPGFEEELLALKKGDEKVFTLPFPEKTQAEELRGKNVRFTTTVKKIEALRRPSLTEEFVKERLSMTGVEAFRKHVTSSLQTREEEVLEGQRKQKLLDAIADATVVEIPQELVDDELSSLLREFAEDLKKQNLSLEQWLKSSGQTVEKLDADLKERARRRLTLRLGIQKLIEDRQLVVSDGEMDEAIESLLSPLTADDRQKIAALYRKGERAYEQLKWQRTVEKLLESFLSLAA